MSETDIEQMVRANIAKFVDKKLIPEAQEIKN